MTEPVRPPQLLNMSLVCKLNVAAVTKQTPKWQQQSKEWHGGNATGLKHKENMIATRTDVIGLIIK